MSIAAFVETVKSKRRRWNPLYQETADYFLPRRAAFTNDVDVSGHDQIFDETGPWSLEQFANGLHSQLTSPSAQWAGLDILSPRLRADRRTLAWRDQVLEACYDVWNAAESGFHAALQEVYQDVGAFAYGVLYPEWSEEAGTLIFQARFPGEIYIVENRFGQVSGVVREYKLTAAQFVETFGADKLPEKNKEQWKNKGTGPDFTITHIVLPRGHPIMKKFRIARRHAFGSIRICEEIDKENPLAVAGFQSFPFLIARWSRWTGDVYGPSPAMTALPAVRRANAIQLDLVKISHRWADPPTQGPHDEFLAPYDLSPGAQNYYRPGTNDRIEAVQAAIGDPTWAVRLLDDTRAAIQRAMFVDAFLSTADSNGQNVKATFVMQRRNETFRQLSAMLSRIEREFLGGIVDFTLRTLVEQQLVPPPPREDTLLAAQFLSPITRAQRGESLDGLFSMVELSAIAAQSDPSAMRIFNWPRIQGDVGANIHALPQAWFKSAEQIAEEEAGAAAQAEALRTSQIAQNFGGALKDVSQVNLQA